MNLIDLLPVTVLHLVEGLVAQDAGVVDHYIDPAEAVQGLFDNALTVGDRVMVGHCRTTLFADLRHYPVGGRGAGAFAMGRTTQIVDHHPGTMPGKQQGMGAAQAAASAGDNHHFIVQANRHARFSSRTKERDARVSASTGWHTIKRAGAEWQAIRPGDDCAHRVAQDQATLCGTFTRGCSRNAR
ncbi:hypothetical protein D3C80_457920 [compost metagenome]